MKHRKNIIVIDDDTDVHNTICENLMDCGYHVLPAPDGEVGLYYLAKGARPDLIITDIIMPNKEGIETILEIKAKYPEIKVLTISGGDRKCGGDFLKYAEKLGSNAVLSKPLNMDELERVVRGLVD